MTHPDTPRLPNYIQIETGKEIASMQGVTNVRSNESKTASAII